MKFLALNVVLVSLCAMLVAQTANNNSKLANSQSNSASTQTVTGCLSRTADTYVLLGGHPVRQYRITSGATQALQGKLGHTVRITGSVGTVESGASADGMYNEGSTAGAGYSTIAAQSVKDLYPNCSGD